MAKGDGVITLGTKNYVVKNIRRYTVDPRGQQTRTTGEYRVSDNGKVTAATFDGDWADMGIFWNKNRRRTGRGVGGIWKSQAETRFHHGIYNGLMETEQTQPSGPSHLKRYLNFNGDLWGLFEEDASASSGTRAGAGKFGATSDDWTGYIAPVFESFSLGEGTSATLTVAHTVQSTRGDRIVIAIVTDNSSGGPSGVTYDGAAMTEVTGSPKANGDISISFFYKLNPSTGSEVNCVASGMGTTQNGMTVFDLSGVDQSTPFGTIVSQAASSSNPTVDVTASVGGLVIGGIYKKTDSSFATETTGQTRMQRTVLDNAVSQTAYEIPEADGTTTFSYTWASSSAHIHAAVGVNGSGILVASGQAASEGVRVFDATTHKGKAWAVTSGGSNGELTYMIFSTPDMATWSEEENPSGNWPTGNLLTTTITRRNNFDDDGARLLDDGNFLWAFLYDYPNGEIECYTTVDDGTNWVNEFNIRSADGPKGAVIWVDRSGAETPLLATAEGVYALDATNNIFTLEIPLDGQSGNGRWMIEGDDGALYIPLAQDDILRVSVESTASGAKYKTERIGPMAAHDGMPAEWRGHANYIMSGKSAGGVASRWLWVLFGGHASGAYATVLCYDYDASAKQGHPVWHCFHDTDLNSITGMGSGNVDLTMAALSAEDDSRVRLHVSAEGSDESIMFHFEEPLVDHDTQSINTDAEGAKYLENCKVYFAGDDHGDPHTGGAIHMGRVDAHELSATSDGSGAYERIEWYRDNLDGGWDASKTATFYSDALSFTLASGLGTSDIGSNHELRFIRRTGSTSSQWYKKAVLHEFQELYSKTVTTLKGYEITIDLIETAKADPAIADDDVETVIDQLETVEALDILVALTVGTQAAINVEMVGNDWNLETVNDGGGDSVIDTGRVASGTARIVLEERL